MADYTPVEPGTTPGIVDGMFVPVEGFGDIDFITRQEGSDPTATLKRVALVLDAKRNMLSAKIAGKSLLVGKNITFFLDTAYLGRGDGSMKFQTGRSGLHVMEARRTATQITTLTAIS